MECPFEATADNVQDLDDKVARHARQVHNIPSLNKRMWTKIHTAEK
jgi:predicted small metal-binding protein